MQRIFGYVYKFINRLRMPNLTVENVRRGTDIVIQTVQMAQLVQNTTKGKNDGTFKQPFFIVTFGVIRLGASLRNSILAFKAPHPVILPKDHPIALAIITYFPTRSLRDKLQPIRLLATGYVYIARLLEKTE